MTRCEFNGTVRGGFSAGPHGRSRGGLVPRYGVMRRQMHQRDFARHASTLRAVDLCGGVSVENIRALNEAFHIAMTGGRVFLTAALTCCPPT